YLLPRDSLRAFLLSRTICTSMRDVQMPASTVPLRMGTLMMYSMLLSMPIVVAPRARVAMVLERSLVQTPTLAAVVVSLRLQQPTMAISITLAAALLLLVLQL